LELHPFTIQLRQHIKLYQHIHLLSQS